MDFKDRLKELRIKNGLTQQHIADFLKVSKSSYVKYERGEREPSIVKLVQLSNYYDVSTDYLTGKSSEENKYIHTIKKSTEFILKENILANLREYKEPLLKMISSYSSRLYDFDKDFLVDLFFMSFSIQEEIEKIYLEGTQLYDYDAFKKRELINEHISVLYEKFYNHISKFRLQIDKYIDILQSRELYDYYENMTDESMRFYFSKEILDYYE